MPRSPLALCAIVPAALSVAALPFGLVDEDTAVYVGIYGLYFALPALLAWLVLRLRARLPHWLGAVLGVMMFPWALVMSTVAIWAGYLIPACAISIGVVLVVAWRLTRRADRPPGGGSR